MEWLALNFFNKITMNATTWLKFSDSDQLKVGKNMVNNRLKFINGLVEYDWLNLSINSYKLNVKEIFCYKTY